MSITPLIGLHYYAVHGKPDFYCETAVKMIDRVVGFPRNDISEVQTLLHPAAATNGKVQNGSLFAINFRKQSAGTERV
jgi:hypothetical protein